MVKEELEEEINSFLKKGIDLDKESDKDEVPMNEEDDPISSGEVSLFSSEFERVSRLRAFELNKQALRVVQPRLVDFGLTFQTLGGWTCTSAKLIGAIQLCVSHEGEEKFARLGKKAFWAKILHEEVQRMWKDQDYTYLSGFVSVFFHGMKWLTPKDERDLGFVRDGDEDEEDAVLMTPSPNFVEVKV
ncbi:hypothetical protein R1flu_009240 [Riccia fluitans]|uniref:Uncharacterized protein n=1 Tax=Riccia fluitans TaxID=41844 RepID=A0ABD1Z1I4_9MARC